MRGSEDSPPGSELWIGPDYGREGAVRLLVLALPRALGPGDLRQVGVGLEARVTGDYVSGALKHVQFTAVARLVLGRPAPRDECEAFWRQVAFHNDPEALRPYLDELRPDALLVLGAEAWRALPGGDSPPLSRGDESGEDELSSGERASPWARSSDEPWGQTRLFRHPGGLCRATCAPHPASSGFSFREHTAVVRSIVAPGDGRRPTF